MIMMTGAVNIFLNALNNFVSSGWRFMIGPAVDVVGGCFTFTNSVIILELVVNG